MHKSPLIGACIALWLVTGTVPADAQDQSDHWNFLVSPYLLGSGMTGDVAINGRSAAVDAGAGGIPRNLELGAKLNLVALLGPWSFTLDFLYMGLGSSATNPPSEVDHEQWIGEFDAGYQIAPWLCAFAGLRVNVLYGTIQFEGERKTVRSGSREWMDPIIGTRLAAPIAEQWTLRGHADIGGFGIGSRLTWQLAGYVDFRASDAIVVVVGYRWVYNDFEQGSANDLFRYDTTVFGPTLGASVAF